jgi:Stage II sporulation protein E (SpoIIE)
MSDAQEDEQQRLLAIGYQRAELTMEQLWLRYFALGGDAGLMEVEAHLHGLMPLPALQRDILAHAINERLDELVWARRVPYSRTIRDGRPDTGPLAALITLLEGTHRAPPDRLPAIVSDAGHALGVQVVIYLVDYDQRRLNPLSGQDSASREPLGVDSTLAGRAFRLVDIVATDAEDCLRLWVPLLDGVERLGVLEVTLLTSGDVRDPGLREQCRWLSALIGNLVTITTQYGDGLDTARRQQPRTPAAELIWELLPPLTAGTDTFVLAGMVEPSYAIGVDAFDYALSQATASLAIFDAMGHTLGAGFITAAVLAAYRSVRRDGHGLYDQARVIDETIVSQFRRGPSATGVLAELELATGRLRYLAAGHAHPLVLRSGKVVKTLTGGRRPPFGVDTPELTIAEEILQPGDWLVLYTDGITEARNHNGEYFGQSRLIDFLEREAAAAHPPPETVRRLTHAVMAHQNGQLQDDATVLLAHWIPGTTETSSNRQRHTMF